MGVRLEVWLSSHIFTHQADHTRYTGAECVDVTQVEEHPRNRLVTWFAIMGADVFQGDAVGQSAGTADFDAVVEDVEQNLRAFQAVIPVRHCVD